MTGRSVAENWEIQQATSFCLTCPHPAPAIRAASGRMLQGCCEIRSLARLVQKTYISASGRMFYFKKHNPWRHLGFLGLALCITDLFSYSSANVMLFSVYASATGRKLWPAGYTAYQTWSHQLFPSSLLSVLSFIQQPMSWEQGSPGAHASHLVQGIFSASRCGAWAQMSLFQVTSTHSALKCQAAAETH